MSKVVYPLHRFIIIRMGRHVCSSCNVVVLLNEKFCRRCHVFGTPPPGIHPHYRYVQPNANGSNMYFFDVPLECTVGDFWKQPSIWDTAQLVDGKICCFRESTQNVEPLDFSWSRKNYRMCILLSLAKNGYQVSEDLVLAYLGNIGVDVQTFSQFGSLSPKIRNAIIECLTYGSGDRKGNQLLFVARHFVKCADDNAISFLSKVMAKVSNKSVRDLVIGAVHTLSQWKTSGLFLSWHDAYIVHFCLQHREQMMYIIYTYGIRYINDIAKMILIKERDCPSSTFNYEMHCLTNLLMSIDDFCGQCGGMRERDTYRTFPREIIKRILWFV